jgi:hypothetical protein
MARILTSAVTVLAACLMLAPVVGGAQGASQPPGQEKKAGTPPGQAKKGSVPPGHATRGCLPPGLAKQLGPNAPCRVYVVFDPEHRDRAWFLVDDQWLVRTDLEVSVRQELTLALELEVPAPPPPPIPLPHVEGGLTVMLFGD